MITKKTWAEFGKKMHKAFESAQSIEEEHARFKAITRISPREAYMFYTYSGRFPTNEEIDIIKRVGINNAINMQIAEEYVARVPPPCKTN